MNFPSLRCLLVLVTMTGACAVPSSEPQPGDDGTIGESEAAATGRPSYSRRNTTLLGKWSGTDYCSGGFDICTDALVQKDANGQWSIVLGPSEYGPNTTLPLVAANGVFVFTTGDGPVSGHDDCQDPGCGNVEKVSGVLYAKKVGNAWVPTLKLSITLDFPYPDEEDAPNGIVHHTSYLTRAR